MRHLLIAAFTGFAVLTLATGAEANGNCPAGQAMVQTGQDCIMGLLDEKICLPTYGCVTIARHWFHGPFLLRSATPTKPITPAAPLRLMGNGRPASHLR